MKKSDITCPNCNAGYRRIELISRRGARGEFRCLLCDEVLEVFDGSTDIALRLTVQPEKTSNSGGAFGSDAARAVVSCPCFKDTPGTPDTTCASSIAKRYWNSRSARKHCGSAIN